MNKNLKFTVLLILFAIFLFQPNFSSAQTLQGGVLETSAEKTLTTTNAIEVLPQFQTVTLRGDFMAFGIGLRGKTSGVITINNIPADSIVEKAYLYWSYLDNGVVLKQSSITFNDTPLVGVENGNGPDTCWGRQFSRAFRADVTTLISGNGTYTISNVLSASPFLRKARR